MPIVKPITVSPTAPQQHRQPSRKGKKAWRKNVDVTEIQEGLEELREEVIKGGIISEKPSAELFTLDAGGDAHLRNKLARISKPLKADEIIAQRSAVPAVSLRKRPGESITDSIVVSKRPRTSYVSHKDLVRLRNIADGRIDSAALEVTEASFDPWAGSRDLLVPAQKPEFSFLEKQKTKTVPSTLKHKPVSLAATGRVLSAVMKPKGGYSYNPMYTEYEDRLIAEGEKEVAAESRRLAALEAERVVQEAAAKSFAEAEAMEARADLSEWDEDSAWEGIESGNDDRALSAKKPERKTQAQRNRIKRRREEERKALEVRKERRKLEQASMAKRIASEVAAKHNTSTALVLGEENESTDEADFELRRRKFGKIALPERDLELVLPEDLQDSLRLLKPEGNLLKDRYRSLLVRGMVECRRPISSKKKRRVKATEKWGHKDFMLH